MEKNETLVSMLCLPYCAYYKPGKNEKVRCRGALIVERLMLLGRTLPPPEKGHNVPDQSVTECLVRLLCGVCDFRENDCDFAQNRHARPCGGFVLLSRLLGSLTISAEEIT